MTSNKQEHEDRAVSRWGRFQDADESGYYEYICKRAGIEVHYCAEQFVNDGSPTSNIIKSVKRCARTSRMCECVEIGTASILDPITEADVAHTPETRIDSWFGAPR